MVRIELIGTEQERAEAFYWIMTTGEAKSPQKDVLFISYPHYQRLKQQKGLKWKAPEESRQPQLERNDGEL